MAYKIIDNYLTKEEHLSLVNMTEHRDFEWYFIKGQVQADDGTFMFNHRFYDSVNGKIKESSWFKLLNDVFLSKLNYKKLFRVKCNLYTKQTDGPGMWHVDHTFFHKSAIYYLNTNNGYTELENGVKVESIANRVCLIDEPINHRIVNQTDTPLRSLVNLTYL